jgi:hypothetical protein
MNKFKLVLAQLGPKPNRKHSLSMILNLDELPSSGWTMMSERSWRTGVTGNADEAIRRAREDGSITAWRSFEYSDKRRSMWIEVIPFASQSDAELEIPHLLTKLMKNSHAKVSVMQETTVDGASTLGIPNSVAKEQITNGKDGPGSAKYAAANVAEYMFAVAYSDFGETSSWDEIKVIAELQVNKIRGQLNSSRSTP